MANDEYEKFADIGLLTIGDGVTVTAAKVKHPSQLVITWERGHRRLFLDSKEARELVRWINGALPKDVT
jgi:hypothetical protein